MPGPIRNGGTRQTLGQTKRNTRSTSTKRSTRWQEHGMRAKMLDSEGAISGASYNATSTCSSRARRLWTRLPAYRVGKSSCRKRQKISTHRIVGRRNTITNALRTTDNCKKSFARTFQQKNTVYSKGQEVSVQTETQEHGIDSHRLSRQS